MDDYGHHHFHDARFFKKGFCAVTKYMQALSRAAILESNVSQQNCISIVQTVQNCKDKTIDF